MKSIFVSYSSKHRDLTRQLAAALEAQYGAGSIWWDYELESWGDYEIQIRNARNEARVVVIWSKAASESEVLVARRPMEFRKGADGCYLAWICACAYAHVSPVRELAVCKRASVK